MQQFKSCVRRLGNSSDSDQTESAIERFFHHPLFFEHIGKRPIGHFVHQPVTLGEYQTVDDKVIWSFRWGTGGGNAASPDWTLVYTFRDGKAVRAQYFQNRTDALQSAGLTQTEV